MGWERTSSSPVRENRFAVFGGEGSCRVTLFEEVSVKDATVLVGPPKGAASIAGVETLEAALGDPFPEMVAEKSS